jgi:hypothetical protein
MTDLRIRHVAILIVLAAVALPNPSCKATQLSEPPPSTVLREVPTNADLRRAAMLSVYFFAIYSSSDWLPEDLRPIELLDAARTLQGDETPYAESRRRRAIANLAAGGLDDPNRREALKILGAPIEDIEELLADLVARKRQRANADPPLATDEAACQSGGIAAIVDLATIDQVFVPAVLDLLAQKQGPAIPGCNGKFSVLSSDYDWWTRKSTVRVGGWVERDFSVVCEKMDPQHWDECSDFFNPTYIALKVGTKYTIESDYSVKPDPNPPPLCTKYARELYEHFDVAFEMPASSGSLKMAWYNQLLSIDSNPLSAGTEHSYGYHLYDAIRSQVGIHEDDGGLDTNEGAVTLKWNATEKRTELELSKTVRFSDRPGIDLSLNAMASVTLRAMSGELHEMACCTK